MRAFLPSVVLTAGLLATGCDTSPTACTEIGCADALYVTVTDGDGLPPAGRYRVAVGADQACAFTVTADGVSDEEEGCQAVFPSTDGVRVGFPPLRGELEVSLSRDGAPSAAQRLRPVYQDRFPNGVDCGAVCQTADVRLTVQ